jgi:hypothetical protein
VLAVCLYDVMMIMRCLNNENLARDTFMIHVHVNVNANLRCEIYCVYDRWRKGKARS